MQPDLLKILGLPGNASEVEVDTAYLGVSQLWRNRRLGASSPRVQAEAEGQEQLLAEAYEVWKRRLAAPADTQEGDRRLPASAELKQNLVASLPDHEVARVAAEIEADGMWSGPGGESDEGKGSRQQLEPEAPNVEGGGAEVFPQAAPTGWRNRITLGFALLLMAGVLVWSRLGAGETGSSRSTLVRAGTFLMGSMDGESGRDSDEVQHQVTLTRDFLMQTTEVTQAQWQARMGNNPSNFTGDRNRPVENVSWYDALAYANDLSESEGLPLAYNLSGCSGTPGTGNYSCSKVTLTASTPYATTGWRLPTEAEWEYAYRAGTSTAWHFGSDSKLLGTYAWFSSNSGSTTHPVAQKQPSAWGLYDMAGNVWEWCWDWDGSYPGTVTDPVGPTSGSARVIRGGSWNRDASGTRAAYRNNFNPGFRDDRVGFRLARSRP